MMRCGFLLTLLAVALLSGCASLPPEPIVEYRTVEIVRDRYVSVQAVIQREKVRQSQIQIAALKAAADARVESITREAEALRGRGLECPALDSDFRRWVLSQ